MTGTDAASDPADVLAEIAGRQHGLVARSQIRDVGLDKNGLRRLVRRGVLTRSAGTVYTFPGHAETHIRDVWTAHLWAGPGSVVSHGTAGRVQHLHPIEEQRLHLSVPRPAECDRLAGGPLLIRGRPVVRHRPRHLGREEVVLVDGLPVTDVPRTILDLAAVLGPTRLRRIVENAAVEDRVSVPELGSRLMVARRPGRPGVARLESILDELGPGKEVPRSELERLLDDALDLCDLPEPEHEYPLPGGDGSERVDRAWPEARLIVEADGRRWHSRRADFERDRRRDLVTAAAGWITIRVTWEMLRSDPAGVARRIAQLYHQRLSRHP